MSLITKDDIKVELNMDDDDIERDNLLDALCLAIVSLFEELTNREMENVAASPTTEYHSTERGQNKVFLKKYPVTSITTLHDDPDREYGAAYLVATADYSYDADSGMIYSDIGFYEGFNNIKVVYKAGYTSATLPAALKQVWTRQISHWLDQAKNKQWHISSIASPTGSATTQAFSRLKENMLPDFVFMAEKFKRKGGV